MARVSVFGGGDTLKSSEREDEGRLVFVGAGRGEVTVTTDGSHARRSKFFSYLSVLEKHVPCRRPSFLQNSHTESHLPHASEVFL